jgi:signal transduction histidine kinase
MSTMNDMTTSPEASLKKGVTITPHLIWGAIVLGGLYLTSLYSFVLFHSLAELFSIGVAVGMFMLAWNARSFMENYYLLSLGIAYLFVAVVDTLHTLAYKGMGVFEGFDANLPTQLWIAGRYLESLSLLAAFFFLASRFRYQWILQGYLIVTATLIFAIFAGFFPDCFVEGSGLTPFKKNSEYVISAILAVTLVCLYRRRAEFDPGIFRLIAASILCTIVAELAFTFYVSVYGLSNLVGHFCKIISFYLIYKAIIETGLTEPYRLLFREIRLREHTIVALNEDLQHHVGRIEEANKELETFSYSVSHDLRAPLRSINALGQILLEEYNDKLDDEGRNYLARINKATSKMAQLINDLLQFSQVSRATMKKVETDLGAMAAEITAEFKRLHPERQVEVHIPEGLTAQGDPTLLGAVLDNLLGNAWKFTAKRAQAVIEFGRTRLDDGRTPFFIKDNGAGLDMSYGDKLFNPFQRLHHENDFPGTGIGLATVQRIINRHGGKVWMEGAVDQGATVYFTLGVDR